MVGVIMGYTGIESLMLDVRLGELLAGLQKCSTVICDASWVGDGMVGHGMTSNAAQHPI